jgi:hypothetical protein
MEYWKENAPGGMTPEQEKEFSRIKNLDKALSFAGKCYDENRSEEWKFVMENNIGMGGLFPKYYLKKENGKLVRKENKIEDDD